MIQNHQGGNDKNKQFNKQTKLFETNSVYFFNLLSPCRGTFPFSLFFDKTSSVHT